MTPEEKAEELTDRFEQSQDVYLKGYAKKCALICVQEIKESLKAISPIHPEVIYWQSVRKEIEKI